MWVSQEEERRPSGKGDSMGQSLEMRAGTLQVNSTRRRNTMPREESRDKGVEQTQCQITKGLVSQKLLCPEVKDSC